MKKRTFFLAFFAVFSVWAHPHVFVDADFALKKITETEVVASATWYFDEFTSESLISDYDLNFNGKIEKQESLRVQKDFAKNLGKFNHFVRALVNGKRTKAQVLNSSATIVGRKMSKKVLAAFMGTKAQNIKSFTYHFDFKLPLPKGAGAKVNISFYDDTVYSVIYPTGKMDISDDIKLKSKKVVESSCEYHFETP